MDYSGYEYQCSYTGYVTDFVLKNYCDEAKMRVTSYESGALYK